MLLSWYHLLAFWVAALVVLEIVPTVQALALKQGWVDRPSIRKVHNQPMARTGGIAICGGTLLALFTVWILSGFSDLLSGTTNSILAVVSGSFAFFLVGLADDVLGLSPLTRLLIQIGVSTAVWVMGVQIEFASIPGFGIVQLGWLSLPLTVIWFTGVVNAINWMDGLDGLASGVSAIAATAIFVICLFTNQIAIAILIAALAGSLIGFLYYNFNPAQIFMGDGGSYFIGSLLAGVSVIGLVKSAIATAVLLPLLILAVPILDMSAVIVTRLWHRRSPFIADKRHLHHRLLKAGLSHRTTVLVIYALALWAGSFAITFAGIPNSLAILITATGLLCGTTWKAWQSIRS